MMRIDVHEPVAAGQQVAKRARRRALETVEAARAVDLHVPAEAARSAARRTAKRAAKQAKAAADRATRRKPKRASKRVVRVVIVAVATGAVVAVAISVARRMRTPPSPSVAGVAPDPFETARELDARDQVR